MSGGLIKQLHTVPPIPCRRKHPYGVQTCSCPEKDLDDRETIVSGSVVQRRVSVFVDVVHLCPDFVQVHPHHVQHPVTRRLYMHNIHT